MRFWTTALAAVLAVGVLGAGDALAAKKEKKKGAKGTGLAGTITKIEGSAPTVTLTVSIGSGKRAKEVTVLTNAGTSVTVDGQSKSVADLKVGGHVSVAPATITAKGIDASTSVPQAGDGKKPGEKKRRKKGA